MYYIVGKKYKQLYQWDKGIILGFDEDLTGAQVHISDNKQQAKVIDCDSNKVQIPDELLQSGRPLDLYICKQTDGQFYTTNWYTIQVIKRPRPEDY